MCIRDRVQQVQTVLKAWQVKQERTVFLGQPVRRVQQVRTVFLGQPVRRAQQVQTVRLVLLDHKVSWVLQGLKVSVGQRARPDQLELVAGNKGQQVLRDRKGYKARMECPDLKENKV